MGGTWTNVVKCIKACEQRKRLGSGGLLLPFDLISHTISFLDHNTQVLSGRLISKRLSKVCHNVVHFGKPLPQFDSAKPTKEEQASAAAWKESWQEAWQPHLQQVLKHLTFRDKFLLLSAAASSGSKVNLELAWGLLRPCLFPELLRRAKAHARCYYLGSSDSNSNGTDTGAAAIAAGHIRLLPWLLQQRCPLDPVKTLEAAAAHCDLAGLQAVWKLLGYDARPPEDVSSWPELIYKVANIIGRSANAPVAKFSWLREAVGGEVLQGHWHDLVKAAAEGAAAAGNLPLLRWLGDNGLDLEGNECCLAPAEALWHGHVAVADWLVEAGCPLPTFPDEDEESLQDVWRRAGGGSVEAVRWLLHHGVPVGGVALKAAAGAGRLEVVQLLHHECGLAVTAGVFAKAAGSRSLPTVTWLKQEGCPMGPAAYGSAAGAGDVAMMRWLAVEARCPWGAMTVSKVIAHWRDQQRGIEDTAEARISSTCSASSSLGQAVRALLGAGCPLGDSGMCMGVAAKRGDLPLLRYLHTERGVDLDPRVLAAAVEGGCEVVLEWLVQVRPKLRHEGRWDPHLGARGNAAALACLRRLRVPLRPNVVGWAAHEDVPLPLVRWLMEQGAQWDSRAVSRVLRRSTGQNRFSDTVVWLEAQLAKCTRVE